MKYNWTWSYGEKQQQSKRDPDKVALIKLNDANAESMKKTHSISLNHDENTWDMMTILNNKTECTNNREELNFKVSNRQMMQQIGNNPFLENNYKTDITNQNVFLMPKISK